MVAPLSKLSVQQSQQQQERLSVSTCQSVALNKHVMCRGYKHWEQMACYAPIHLMAFVYMFTSCPGSA